MHQYQILMLRSYHIHNVHIVMLVLYVVLVDRLDDWMLDMFMVYIRCSLWSQKTLNTLLLLCWLGVVLGECVVCVVVVKDGADAVLYVGWRQTMP